MSFAMANEIKSIQTKIMELHSRIVALENLNGHIGSKIPALLVPHETMASILGDVDKAPYVDEVSVFKLSQSERMKAYWAKRKEAKAQTP